MRMIKRTYVRAIVVWLTVFTCAPATAAEFTADRALIARTYSKWAKATQDKDIERWSGFLAPNALFLPPGHHTLRTRDAIRGFYLELFADPNFSIRCEQLEIKIAVSGEMAWSWGQCEVTFTGPDGQIGGNGSTWAKVWLKQPDGSWKCRINAWSSNPS